MINQYNILTLRWSLSLAKSVYLKCLGLFERATVRERKKVREGKGALMWLNPIKHFTATAWVARLYIEEF